MHAYMYRCTYLPTTKLNKNLFSNKWWKIVNDLSLRHDLYRIFHSPGPSFYKTFDRLKPEDVIQSPDLEWTKTKDRLCKLTKESEFVAAGDENNGAIKTDIKIKV